MTIIASHRFKILANLLSLSNYERVTKKNFPNYERVTKKKFSYDKEIKISNFLTKFSKRMDFNP